MRSFEVIACCTHFAGEKCERCTGLQSTVPGGAYNTSSYIGFSDIGTPYNLAVEDWGAKDVLVFTHTDIRCLASDALWEKMLDKCMEEDTGFVGVAGSTYLGKSGLWWDCPPEQAGMVQRGAIQTVLQNSTLRGHLSQAYDGKSWPTVFGPYGQVVVLDSVFIAIASDKIKKLGAWREDMGWYFSDMDMTLRAHLAGYKNYAVMFPIMHVKDELTNYGAEWEATRQKFCKLYEDKLPVRL